MSPTFSFSRLGKLITKQFFENSKFYIFSVLALFGLLAIVFSLWSLASFPRYDEMDTYNIYIGGLFLAGTVFASISFSMLGSKDKGIYWLSIPATHVEKLVCTIFYTTVVFTLVYTLVFIIVQSLCISIVTGYIADHPFARFRNADVFSDGPRTFIFYLLCAYFAVQSLYLLGSVYFPRYAFILTTVVGAAVIFAVAFYLRRIEVSMFSPADWEMIEAKKANPASKGSYFVYSVSPGVVGILKNFLQFGLAPLFWIITLYRLREKEI